MRHRLFICPLILAMSVALRSAAQDQPPEPDSLRPASAILISPDGFEPGSVIVQLRRVPNYPQSLSPLVEDRDFTAVTLLKDGMLVVASPKETHSIELAPLNLASLAASAAQLARVPVKAETAMMLCTALPPMTRTALSVAAYDETTKRYSPQLGTVWLEDDCSYRMKTMLPSPLAFEMAAELRGRLSSLAWEALKATKRETSDLSPPAKSEPSKTKGLRDAGGGEK